MSKPDKGFCGQGFGALFAPIRVGRLTLKNRVVAAPTQSSLSSKHEVTWKLKALYAGRARGGAGLVMGSPATWNSSIQRPTWASTMIGSSAG